MSEWQSTDGAWARARAGDAEAFARIFDAYRDRVFRHALRFVEEAHQAEDITAMAFLELWRRRDAVRVVAGSVLPWLLVTTTNVGRNQRRAALRHRRFLAALRANEDQTVVVPPPEVTSERLDLSPELRAALATLRGADLHLLVLVALEDYSMRDAATALGLTESAAKSRMHRIRADIRGQLPVFETSDSTVARR